MIKKKLKQQRSRDTVDAISEAFIQVLNESSTEAFTTNHIAERSGFSIGTVYRYFPDKGAILRFVGRRVLKAQSEKVMQRIANSTAKNPEDFMLEVIDASLDSFSSRHKALHNLRELAQHDETLLNEANKIRAELIKKIHKRLSMQNSERFPAISDDFALALGEVYKNTIISLGRIKESRILDHSQLARIANALLEVLSARL